MDSLTPGRLFFDISVFPPPPAIQPYLVTVELLIEDINNHSPEIKAPTTVEIPEDTAPGRGILTFDVHDQVILIFSRKTGVSGSWKQWKDFYQSYRRRRIC